MTGSRHKPGCCKGRFIVKVIIVRMCIRQLFLSDDFFYVQSLDFFKIFYHDLNAPLSGRLSPDAIKFHKGYVLIVWIT